MMLKFKALGLMCVVATIFSTMGCWVSTARAQPACQSPVVAFEAFDVNLNVISGFDPGTENLDGGGGDFFGVGDIATWPQGTPVLGVPFSLADDSVVSVSTNGIDMPFPGDDEGVFGQAKDVNDAFFAISDTREWVNAGATPTASWEFDVSSVTCGLELHIDMGAQANSSFGGFSPDSLVTFEYQFDGGDVHTAFSITPNANFGNFSYRPMDIGSVTAVGANGPLEVTGDMPVAKLEMDTGLVAADTFLNKTPTESFFFGAMDRFMTSLIGQGDTLRLTMTADLPFEAMAFDNIEIIRIPEPTGAARVAFVALAITLLRRRRS